MSVARLPVGTGLWVILNVNIDNDRNESTWETTYTSIHLADKSDATNHQTPSSTSAIQI